MNKPNARTTGESRKWYRFISAPPPSLKSWARLGLIAMAVLIMVWCGGRALEAFHGNAVFDAGLTGWLGVIFAGLLMVWSVGLLVRCWEALTTTPSRKTAAAAWIGFFVLAALVLVGFEGFKILAEALLAAFGGSAQTVQNATFLLAKFHPGHPMLAVGLLVQTLTGTAWDTASLAPFIWHWNVLFLLFVWSFGFGIALLMRPQLAFLKVVHLTLSALGLAALILLKSKSMLADELMITFQAGVSVLLLLQVLVVYASLRIAAAEGFGDVAAQGAAQGGEDRRPHRSAASDRGLPPSAVAVALSIVFVLPLVADLDRQAELAAYSRQLIQETATASTVTDAVLVTVAPVSIRSGPSLGDEILGVLPKGARVQVKDIRFDWVDMGRNNWVPEKFLRPLIDDQRASKVNADKRPS